MLNKKTLLMIAPVALAACGGTSSSTPDVTQLDFAEISALEVRLDQEISAFGVVQAGDIPDTGLVNYQGTLAMDVRNDPMDGVLGELSLSANLDGAASTFSGSADNFYSIAGTAVTGSVDLTNMVFSSDPALPTNFIIGDLAGTVQFSAGELVLRGATGAGYLFGTDAEYISASNMIALGTPVAGGDDVTIDGSFYAEKQ